MEETEIKPTEKVVSEIEQTQTDRLKLKQENDSMDAELLRAEKLRAQSRMSGKGFISSPETLEETPQDYAKKVMAGKIDG